MDELAIQVPSLDAWDQFIWPLAAAMPWALTEAEQYSYHHSQTVDLGSVMLAMQFRVTDEVGTYLCVARALVFKGSILAYNTARDEEELVPVHGLTNDLTWMEERSAMALVNYVPHISQEVAQIARLGACQLVSWPANSCISEEEDKEEEAGEEREEVDPEPPIMNAELEQSKEDQEGEQEPSRQHSLDWEMVTGEEDSTLMTHGWIRMPQLMATPRDIRPHVSQGHQWRRQWRCTQGSQRWRTSEMVGHDGHRDRTGVPSL